MDFLLFFIIIVIAFFYSSAGHGGATAYLAVMAILGFAPEVMKPTALVLNLVVASVSFMVFYKAGYFRLKLILPFIISSVPMAYIGAQVIIDPKIYKIILGILLLIGAIRILYKPSEAKKLKEQSIIFSLLIGAALGFFSGMIGIGGGIILSPIIILLGWGTVKQTAAVATVFIFLTSAAGLLGIWNSGVYLESGIFLWITAALIGGSMGSFYGGFRFSFVWLKYILSGVIIFASLKLFMF